ncbi:hypothetical protein Sjap_021274 [Stephania japonica]|uniref:Reverse transcriptase zinc-binding domain-containing protein n=1 Tax=Stephania japonica TaxID=461633 RepID=A0AAP0ERX8_9MAGN
MAENRTGNQSEEDTVSGVIGVGYDRATDPSFTGSVHCTPICYLCVGIHAFPFEQLPTPLILTEAPSRSLPLSLYLSRISRSAARARALYLVISSEDLSEYVTSGIGRLGDVMASSTDSALTASCRYAVGLLIRGSRRGEMNGRRHDGIITTLLWSTRSSCVFVNRLCVWVSVGVWWGVHNSGVLCAQNSEPFITSVLTNDVRHRRHMTDEMSCGLCGGDSEDLDHILWGCPLSSLVWKNFKNPRQFEEMFMTPLNDWIIKNLCNNIGFMTIGWPTFFAHVVGYSGLGK